MNKAPNFFKYMGGKYKYTNHLIERFPEHQCYVEVFGGAGNVLIQKPPTKVEIFNDINSDIVNLFRVLRNDYDAFIAQIENVPYSREEYHAFKEQLKTETESIQRAVMWYAVACMSFAGKHGNSWGFGIVDSIATQFKNKVSRLHEIRDRLRSVQIENKDFEFILKHYDSKDTFFYLDPPYLPETRVSTNDYTHEMTYEDHEKLLDILKGIKGKVMLSGYPNVLYDTLQWNAYSFDTLAWSKGVTKVSKTRERAKRTEVIYMNYEHDNFLL